MILYGAMPRILAGRDAGRVGHQAPRSASRYRRTRIRSVSSPPSMTVQGGAPSNASLGGGPS